MKNNNCNLLYIRNLINEELNELGQYPSNFSMDEFKSIRSFAGRIRYCEGRLQRIASGSSRIVYKVDNNVVLKLAKNRKGLAQNEAEGGDYYLKNFSCFAEVYDIDDNYQWIEMEQARKAKVSDFKRITGYDFNFLRGFVNYVYSLYSNKSIPWNRISKEEEKYYQGFMESENFEYSLFHDIYNYMADYQLNAIGDILRISSWGVVNREGEDELVLVDFGLTDIIYNDFYR